MALKKEHPEQLAAAKTFLMVPDYLNYLLCGVPANEYTNASTTLSACCRSASTMH